MTHIINLVGNRSLQIPPASEFQALFGDSPVAVMSHSEASTLNVDSDHLVAILVTRGTVSIERAGNVLPLASRQVFLADKAPLRLVSRPGGAWLALVVPVTLVMPEIEDLKLEVTSDCLVFPVAHSRARKVARPMLRLVREARSPQPVLAVLRAQWREFVRHVTAIQQRDYGAMIARCPGRAPAVRRQNFARLFEIKQWVERDGAPNISVAQLARKSGYSQFHFIRVFNRVFGQTPRDFMTEVRLARVLAMMSREDLGISDAARTVGFDNRCSFSRLFRQHFGMSASEYRRSAWPFLSRVRRGAAAPRGWYGLEVEIARELEALL